MSTYSRADLATRVLKDLGILGANETATADDLAWVEETISSEISMLAVKSIPVANGSDEAIPIDYFTALSRRIGLAIGPSFGLFSIAEAEQAMPLAETNLRILSAKGATGSVLETEYY